ncbi:MAG: AAA family ATPase [Alphaproteobacteria bacterium]
MLISFSVANFRSIKDEQTINFRASSKYSGDSRQFQNNIFKTNNLQIAELVRATALYGANASGKSNLIKAFYNCGSIVLYKKNRGDQISTDPFLLNSKIKELPTSYSIDFIAKNQVRYIYSFSFDNNRIHHEKLEYFENKTNSSAKLIYEITFKKGRYIFSDNLNDKLGEQTRNIFKNTENNLLLHLLVNVNTDNYVDPDNIIPVYDWFKFNLEVMFSHDQFSINSLLLLHKNKAIKKSVLDLVKKFDLSIIDIEIEEYVDEKFLKFIETASDIPEAIKNKYKSSKPMMLRPKFVHKYQNKKINFKESQVSSGTRNLIYLLPQVFLALSRGGVLIFDEIDCSLHPDILLEVVKIFQNPEFNKTNAQILFTVHNDILLEKSYELFRRDQVWFASKDDNDQSTQIYSLADFNNIRNDHNIVKHYRNHEYGARPFIGE